MTQEIFNKFIWATLTYLSYSCDVELSYYHLFRSTQNFWINKEFKNENHIKQAASTFIDTLYIQFYQDSIKKLDTLDKVFDNDANYIFELN